MPLEVVSVGVRHKKDAADVLVSLSVFDLTQSHPYTNMRVLEMYTISKISKTYISISCNALQVDLDDKGSVTREQMSLVLQILGVLLHQQSRMDKTHQIESALCMKKAKRACLPQCCSTCFSESSLRTPQL